MIAQSYLARSSGISCLTFHSRPNFHKSLPRGLVCCWQFITATMFEPMFSSPGGIQNDLVSVLLFHHCYSFREGGSVMFGRKLLWSTAVLTAAVVIVALASPYSRAELFWTEDFESYGVNGTNIAGKDSTWSHISYPNNVTEGQISTAFAHLGSRSLSVESYTASFVSFFHGSQWYDDTPTFPHGGVIDLSWWMYVDSNTYNDPSWLVSVLARLAIPSPKSTTTPSARLAQSKSTRLRVGSKNLQRRWYPTPGNR